MTVPDTRHSLILRLPDSSDTQAWDEFVAIYQPVVYRMARRQGLQHADAQELVQEVLLSVSRAVERWDPNRERGRFRDWLFQIARNRVINYLTRRRHRPIGTGDSNVARWLEGRVDPASDESSLFELEYRRSVFRHAADAVRASVRESTWSAFWLSSVQGEPIAHVASELGMTTGSVYIARSRVMTRLQQEVQRLQLDTGDAGRAT